MYPVCFFKFFYLHPHIDAFTMHVKAQAKVTHIYTQGHLHLKSHPAVSQFNWQCFQGTPRWAICGALIRVNKRACHRKPQGITHGSSKPQDMIDGGIGETLWGVQRGTGQREAEEVRMERKGWQEGRREAQRRKPKQMEEMWGRR